MGVAISVMITGVASLIFDVVIIPKKGTANDNKIPKIIYRIFNVYCFNLMKSLF